MSTSAFQSSYFFARFSRRLPRLGILALASLLMCCASVRAQTYQGQSQLWFDSSGTDEASFGLNEIITVSGNLTFMANCANYGGGINDNFASTAAALYVIRHNTSSNSLSKLNDVRGGPSVISSGFFGNAFVEQVLSFTQPQGVLGSGNYDVVINECENGIWDAVIDLRLGGAGDPPAFNVFIPANIDDLIVTFNPEIELLKNNAALQEQKWRSFLYGQSIFLVHPQSLYLTALGLDWRSYEISLEA